MKIRKKTSVVWAISHEELQVLLNTSDSVVEVLQKLGLDGYSGNHRTLKTRLENETFDLSQLNLNRKAAREKLMYKIRKPIQPNSEIFIKNGHKVSFSVVKSRIKKQKLLKYQCFECGNLGTHNNKLLSLQVDHINGISTDHRLENLRYLCPNCHSQTETFSGKRLKKEKTCNNCGQETRHHSSRMCKPCHIKTTKIRPELDKIKWPECEVLKKLVWEKPLVQVAQFLGVSDVAVKWRCKKYNIETPPRGFWLKGVAPANIPKKTGRTYIVQNITTGEMFEVNHLTKWAKENNLSADYLRELASSSPRFSQHKGFSCRLKD